MASERQLTGRDVQCAKCSNCMNNQLRILNDSPRNKDKRLLLPCLFCYAERMDARADLLYAKMGAIRAASNYYFDAYGRSFGEVGATEDGDFIRRHKSRLAIMERWRDTVNGILGMKDELSVKAERDRYDNLYFGKEAKE